MFFYPGVYCYKELQEWLNLFVYQCIIVFACDNID